MLSVAFAGWLLAPLKGWARWLIGLGSLLMIVATPASMALGLAISAPVLLRQVRAFRRTDAEKPARMAEQAPSGDYLCVLLGSDEIVMGVALSKATDVGIVGSRTQLISGSIMRGL
ncbi:hypothetical protein [Bosea sp. BH3]|uniref:hypothetical protein n=1 Tax=Bosea sp. BH3 TaxID=2871701 RepID=UPI0021CAF9B7|nr:hypothetical protein [Bosea sp. BH3]MCU4179719.1 hypothetical protein [Bosea sp. BH3]